MSHHSNVINRITSKVKRLEKKRPIVKQFITEKTIKLENNDFNKYYILDDEVFSTNITTNQHQLLYINFSASFMTDVKYIKTGSVILKMKINGDQMVENEALLQNYGYNHVTLNYTFRVDKKSIYTIEIFAEGFIETLQPNDTLPNIFSRNHGISVSIYGL